MQIDEKSQLVIKFRLKNLLYSSINLKVLYKECQTQQVGPNKEDFNYGAVTPTSFFCDFLILRHLWQ